MTRVTMIETFDGIVHRDTKEAERHLNKLLTAALGVHAHRLAGKKYMEVVDYLSDKNNLFAFSQAYAIMKDIQLDND